MKKIIYLLFFTLLLISSIGSAKEKVIAEPDFNNSIIFYAWDSSGKSDWANHFAGSQAKDTKWRNIVFLKHIDSDNNCRYWIRIDSPDEKKYLQNGYLYIDDETYPINQIDQWNRLLLMSGRSMIEHAYYPVNFAFYDIPEELMQKIAEADDSSKIILMFERTERPLGVRLDKEFRAEIKTLSTVTRIDYDKYKLKDKETIEKKKTELSTDTPKLTYDQMKAPHRY